MARFGLSPYSDPVDAGVNTMSKVMTMFNQQDQMKLNQQQTAQTQQLHDLQIQQAQNNLADQEADKPIKDADREIKKMQQMYGPTLAGLMARQKVRNPGDQFELAPEEIGMIKHLGDKTGAFGPDAKSQIEAALAIQNLAPQMRQVMQSIQAQGAQAGPSRIDDQNHPEILKNVNSVPALRKMLTGDENKAVTSVLIDPKTGNLTAAVAADRPDKSPWGTTGKRADGSDKSYGWQGTWKTKDGKDISELSVGVEIDGKEVDVPTLIPTTTPKERKWIVDHSGDEGAFKTAEGHAIIAKAADFASSRIAAGKSPFASDDESPKSVLVQDDDGYKSVKLGDLQYYMKHAQKFAPMLYQANAQLHGDPKLAAEVQEHLDNFDFLDDKSDVLEKINKTDKSELEKRQDYIQEMAKKGHQVTKPDAETEFPAKMKPRNLIHTTEGVPGNPLLKRPVAVDQDTGERVFTGEPMQEYKPEDSLGREIKADRLSREKQADEDKKKKAREDAIKGKEALVQKSPAFKDADPGEIHDEATRLVDAQDAGKPAGKSEKKKAADHLQPLKDSFNKDGIDYDYLAKSADNAGWTEAEIRKAATSDDAKEAVDKYFSKKKPAAKSGGSSDAQKVLDKYKLQS